MKQKIKNLTAVTLLVATSFTMTGCFGSFSLTTKLHSWNKTVSGSKFVNELVFLGLTIIPVYELALLGDALIFNTIEFWGEANPVAMKDGEVETQTIKHKGQEYEMTKSLNNLVIKDITSGQQAHFSYIPAETSWYLMENGQPVKVVEMKKGKVFTYLPNEKTLVFESEDAKSVNDAVVAAIN